MDYPLAASLFAHDTPDDPLRSYNVVKGEFNGLAELDQRLNENPEEVFENLLLVLGNMPVVLNEETEDFDSLYATKLLAAFSDIEPAVANRYSTEYLQTGDPDITVEAYYNLTWSAHGLTASQANAINQEYLEENGSNSHKHVSYLLQKGTWFTGIHIIIYPVRYPFKTVRHRLANILNRHRFATHT